MSTSETPSQEIGDQYARSAAPIIFRGSLTVPDAYAAISLAQPLGNKIAMWIVRAFFVVALVYMGWLTAFAYYGGEHNLTRMAFAGMLLVLLPICVAVGREIWYRKRAFQLCKQGKLLYAPTEGEIDGDSIRTKTETDESTLKWSAFCGYREGDNVAVLYLHYPGSCVIVARSKFGNDQDWASFLQLVSQKLKRR